VDAGPAGAGALRRSGDGLAPRHRDRGRHARLILERFGWFWGAFSVIDLFLLNALTIVTEFIGISLALDYLGLPREVGVIAAAAIIIAAAGTGDFRRFERFSLLLVFGSLLLIPVFVWVHPPIGEMAHGLIVPQLPSHGKPSDVILLIIAIVGTHRGAVAAVLPAELPDMDLAG
jgi:Mn2+/Fe2+ NRAMP family transporter